MDLIKMNNFYLKHFSTQWTFAKLKEDHTPTLFATTDFELNNESKSAISENWGNETRKISKNSFKKYLTTPFNVFI
jgi:hypothetical protein